MRKKRKDDLITSINTRYPQDILDEMRALAAKHQRSLNGEIVWALRQYIKQVEEPAKRKEHYEY